MKNSIYAILRVSPFKGWSAVAAMARHGRRMGGDMDHVNIASASLNRYGSDWAADARDIRACMEAVIKNHGATARKNAPVGSHLLLAASPGYFRPNAPDAFGTFDADKLEPWLAANLAWVHQRWPKQVAAWRLDLDEATPHLDVFLVPIAFRRTRGGRAKCEISHREAFGKSRKSFAELQDAYARAMAPLGLTRGRPRSVTGAVHVHPAALRLKMKEEAQRQLALRVGTEGIFRRDVRNLRLGPDGSFLADFAPGVPMGVRPRFLNLMHPAARTLIHFERQVSYSVKRLAKEAVDFVVDEAHTDREQAANILDEALALSRELGRNGVLTPPDLRYRLERLAAELTR